MKKHDEGYALVYVLIVMVILCLVASSLMTMSLGNLKTQQQYIQRMQDKYSAQGAIEQVVARLNNCSVALSGESVKAALEDGIAAICDDIYNEEQENEGNSIVSSTDADPVKPDGTMEYTYVFTMTAQSGSASVTCTMKLEGITSSSQEGGTELVELNDVKLTYLSYEIGEVSQG